MPVGNVTELKTASGQIIFMDEDSVFFSGDVIFSKEQVTGMMEPMTRSAVVKSVVSYWPNKFIPYSISKTFSTSDVTTIKQALSDISKYTGIQFVQQDISSKSHYLRFIYDTKANFSPLGMQSGGNAIHIQPNLKKGIYLHEIMHSLGFFHEFTRTDRDKYVDVHLEVVEAKMRYNFDKYSTHYQGYDVGAFDFNSVMMYGSFAFSNSLYPSMTKHGKDMSAGYINANISSLSDGDIKGLKFVYGPEKLVLRTNIIESNEIDGIIEDYTFSNTVYFEDVNGNRVTLASPRLIVADFNEYSVKGQSGDTNNTSSVTYFVAPAGSSSFSLGNTSSYTEEDGYGIIRQHEEDSYSLYNF